jgi:hypothetical protein
MTARLAWIDQGFNMREPKMEEEVIAAAALAAIALQSATLKALATGDGHRGRCSFDGGR